MHEPKSFASLTSGLLARKGFAKPAMRPQAYGTATSDDDLGWNDMGSGYRPTIPGPDPMPSLGLTPARVQDEEEVVPADIVPADAVPAVVLQQSAVAESIGAEPEPVEEAAPEQMVAEAKPAAAVVSIAAARGAMPARAKAAFTLRLDPERHLRLRLACAVDNRSAQQIVTQALDEFLDQLPEIDELAGRVPARGKRKG